MDYTYITSGSSRKLTVEGKTINLQRAVPWNFAYKTRLAAIEKDWWVTAVLKALFQTSCKDALSFKGGTSLSKSWGIIERLSEDIDLALDHSFFGMEELRERFRAIGHSE